MGPGFEEGTFPHIGFTYVAMFQNTMCGCLLFFRNRTTKLVLSFCVPFGVPLNPTTNLPIA